MSKDTNQGDKLTPAHLMLNHQGTDKAREMRKLITELYAKGHTVELIDPTRKDFQ